MNAAIAILFAPALAGIVLIGIFELKKHFKGEW
jgi:hypothetical protein